MLRRGGRISAHEEQGVTRDLVDAALPRLQHVLIGQFVDFVTSHIVRTRSGQALAAGDRLEERPGIGVLDLPGVFEFAADDDLAQRLKALAVVMAGDRCPAHGRRVAEQHVRGLLVLADRIALRALDAAPAHDVHADRAHQRRLGLPLAGFQPARTPAPTIGRGAPAEQASANERVPFERVERIAGRRAIGDLKHRRQELQEVGRFLRPPEQSATLAVADIAQVPLRRMTDQFTGREQLAVDCRFRPGRRWIRIGEKAVRHAVSGTGLTQ